MEEETYGPYTGRLCDSLDVGDREVGDSDSFDLIFPWTIRIR